MAAPIPADIRDAAVAAYDAGEPSTAVAKRFGVSPASVLSWAHKAGVEIHSKGRAAIRTGCEIAGCHRPHLARGYCDAHYKREVVRHGSVRRAPSVPLHIEDIEWMAETGEVWERAAERLGVKEKTLMRFLERAGRYDLVRQLRRTVAA